MTNPHTPVLHISTATESDRSVLEQLWTMFSHDMSAHSGTLPDVHGRFRQERLDNALTRAAWCGYVIRLDAVPVGFCIVREVGSPEQVISSFFLVNAARRLGHGRVVVRAVTSQHRGPWAVAFQEANTAAAAFWRSIAAETDPGWASRTEPVSGRPDLPPDVWVRFWTR